MEYKIELIKLGKKQVDVVNELSKRGIKTCAQELSQALSGLPRPKLDLIRNETDKIISDWKAEADNNG